MHNKFTVIDKIFVLTGELLTGVMQCLYDTSDWNAA